MDELTKQIETQMRALKLKGMLSVYKELSERAAKGNLQYEEYLALLLEEELRRKTDGSIKNKKIGTTPIFLFPMCQMSRPDTFLLPLRGVPSIVPKSAVAICHPLDFLVIHVFISYLDNLRGFGGGIPYIMPSALISSSISGQCTP